MDCFKKFKFDVDIPDSKNVQGCLKSVGTGQYSPDILMIPFLGIILASVVCMIFFGFFAFLIFLVFCVLVSLYPCVFIIFRPFVSLCRCVLVPFKPFKSFVSLCLCVLVSLSMVSCTYSEFNLATGQQETLIYSTEKEERIGLNVAAQLENHYDILWDDALQSRLKKILERIEKVCDRKELVYTIKVIDEEDEINAVSLPGGHVYMFKGLTDKLKTDDELAAVIAHEVGHITARHSMKRLQASHGMLLLQLGAIAADEGSLAQGVGAAYQTAFLAYSRQDEFQADKLSVKYLQRAGYDVTAIIRVLKMLQEEQRKRAPSHVSYFRTHPYVEERIAVVRREISGQLDFESYLDLTGQETDRY